MARTQISAKVPVLKKGVHLMTSDFGPRTYTHNGKKVSNNHKGVDLIGKGAACDYIIAAADGRVTIAKYSDSAGYYVQINHGNGVYTRYMHMKAGTMTVAVGDSVKKGQVLGYMGSTGNSTGAHLHFDVCVNGSYVDPKPYLAGEKSLVTKVKETTNTTTAPIYKVGDIVNFEGTAHYKNASAVKGKTCKPGKAKVIGVCLTGKHPYQLKKISGGGSTVYGWVDAADISGASAEASATTETPAKTITVGSTVKLNKGAKTYTGGNIALFVYNRNHKVKSIKGDRVVITYAGVTVAAVKLSDLTLIS